MELFQAVKVHNVETNRLRMKLDILDLSKVRRLGRGKLKLGTMDHKL